MQFWRSSWQWLHCGFNVVCSGFSFAAVVMFIFGSGFFAAVYYGSFWSRFCYGFGVHSDCSFVTTLTSITAVILLRFWLIDC